ncbi:MAG: hypothetical protein QXM96_03065 [Candidatus Woesearchaeota archaeon]
MYFDAPIFESNIISGIPYLTQPFYPFINESWEILLQFDRLIRPEAMVCDPVIYNLGFFERMTKLEKEDLGNRVFLIDYDSVVRF